MRQTRMIRISFLICAAVAVAAFWSGFYFGQTNLEPAEILTAQNDAGTDFGTASAQNPKSGEQQVLETQIPKASEKTEDAAESGNGLTDQDQYYIRDTGEYLTVYHSGTDSVYFETDLKLSDLPEDLQKEAKTGIPFYDIEDLYDFLENYSS